MTISDSTTTASVTGRRVSTSPADGTGRRGVATAIGLGAVGAAVVNGLIAAIARGPLDASSDFQPLTPGAFVFWSIVGAVVGALGWSLIQRRAQDPARLLRVLVPAVLVLSLVPDVAIWVQGSMTGINSTGVLALMAMHVATAAVLVPVFQRFIR